MSKEERSYFSPLFINTQFDTSILTRRHYLTKSHFFREKYVVSEKLSIHLLYKTGINHTKI